MKRLFLTIGLVAAGSLAYGQGTVNFSNGSLFRNSTAHTSDLQTAMDAPAQSPTTVSLEYGLFFGIGQSTSLTLLTAQFGVSSTTGNGLIASPADSKTALTLVGIPGTNPGETDVFLQFRAWSASFGTDWTAALASFDSYTTTTWYGQSKIANITAGMGAATGPGATIWGAGSNATGTVIPAMTILNPVPVPEPATFGLAGLGAAAMLIFRRRK